MAENLSLDRWAMKDPSTSHLRIYVGNLPDDATVEGLYGHFQCYGQINGIVANAQMGFGFVQFELESSAQKAINEGNGSNYGAKKILVKTAFKNIDRKPDVTPNVSTVEPSHTNATQEPLEEEQNTGKYNQGLKEQIDNFHDADNAGGNNYDMQNQSFDGGRGRDARRRGQRGRGGFQGDRGYRADRSPVRGGDWGDRGGYDRYPQPVMDYQPPPISVMDKNDCEIIVVSKALTEYAEYIEGRLKRLGIVVDLLFPMEDVPIGKVLGNIASRGCLYAILVMPQNQEHRSLTLTILHGLPQEHRNMPLEEALQLVSRNFIEIQRGTSTNGKEAIFALLGQLADGKTLTMAQLDKVIEYVQGRREQQSKVELGTIVTSKDKTEADLQQRILSILNDKKATASPQPTPVPPPAQKNLLNDPTVRLALDSILQKFK